ncbi:MAG: hydantoinase/oxoprolinase family protein, partial [Ilumatobacter sp.]
AERTALLDDLRTEGRRVLAAAGSSADAVRFRYGLDCRYAGQGNEVTVWVGQSEPGDVDAWPVTDDEVLAAFESEYKRIFGLAIPDVPIEIVTWRLAVSADAEQVAPEPVPAATGNGAEPVAHRPMVFGRGMDPVNAPVYKRDQLGGGATFSGPCVVEERETTAVIRPGWNVEVGPDGSLIATNTASERGATT